MSNLIAELREVEALIDTVRGIPNGTVAHSAGLRIEASACVSFLRTHHAEIAAAVRKASRYDWLIETIPGQICMEALHRPPMPDDDIDHDTDQRIAAMSAREGQG